MPLCSTHAANTTNPQFGRWRHHPTLHKLRFSGTDREAPGNSQRCRPGVGQPHLSSEQASAAHVVAFFFVTLLAILAAYVEVPNLIDKQT